MHSCSKKKKQKQNTEITWISGWYCLLTHHVFWLSVPSETQALEIKDVEKLSTFPLISEFKHPTWTLVLLDGKNPFLLFHFLFSFLCFSLIFFTWRLRSLLWLCCSRSSWLFYLWRSLRPTSWSGPCPSTRSRHWTGNRRATHRWRTLRVEESQRRRATSDLSFLREPGISNNNKTKQRNISASSGFELTELILGSSKGDQTSWKQVEQPEWAFLLASDPLLSAKTLHGRQTDHNYGCYNNTEGVFIRNNSAQSCKHAVAPRQWSN